jgi:hypothetical protein
MVAHQLHLSAKTTRVIPLFERDDVDDDDDARSN